jgi:dTMP kinase
MTAEPTSLPTGRLVRQVLKGEVDARPETLARLFSADRHEHLYGPDGIVERLGRGELVVCDRYVLSSLAYQGVSCGPDLPRLLNAAFPLPELLIFFDLPASVAMERLSSRPEREIFETHSIQERVRKAYEDSLAEFAGSGMRIHRVDASLGLEEVSKGIETAIESLIA